MLVFFNKLISQKLEQNDGLIMFFIPEKQQKTILNISLDSLVETK